MTRRVTPPVPVVERMALKTEDAAKLLSVSRSQMYELRKRPDGPPWVRVGNSIRWPRHALEAWIEERTQRGPAS